jgi:rare lipoprotein A
MGRSFAGATSVGIARNIALALGCLIVASCTGGANYSERVVADGEPVPKGGGVYRVGKPYNINGRTYVPNENTSYRAEGVASWYGPDFHGRLTANGEVYDMHAISAAHPTMPLPSYARVTNLDNKRSIVVRVNDRGPYVRNRIMDLSIGTAKALGFYGHGLARVRVEYVGRAPIEGSDDEMLLATLREGSPAPAPSKVMVAAAKPFLPKASAGQDMALPSDRRFSAGASTPPLGAPSTEATSQMRVRSASADPRFEAPMLSAPAPAAARQEGSTLGLMSGRGLY